MVATETEHVEQPGEFDVGVAIHQMENAHRRDEEKPGLDQIEHRDGDDAPVARARSWRLGRRRPY